MPEIIVVPQRNHKSYEAKGYKTMHAGIPRSLQDTELLKQHIWKNFQAKNNLYHSWRKLVTTNDKIALCYDPKQKALSEVAKNAMNWLIANPNF